MNSNSIKNLQDNTTNNDDGATHTLHIYLEKINKSFFYAERVLIISALVMFLGFIFFITTKLHGIEALSNVKLFETSLLTVNLFFILFLTIILFAFAHKLLLDFILWKQHNIKLPLFISFITLIIIGLSTLMPPISAFITMLFCSLSVGIRVHSKKFLSTLTEITQKDSTKL